MIELFSHKLDAFELNGDTQCTPIPVEDELSSLSAILLNDEYYDLITNSYKTINNVPIVTPECLIALKVKAFLNLTERKAAGEAIDSDKIKKHKYDVFRVAQIIAEDRRLPLAAPIKEDFKRFIGPPIHQMPESTHVQDSKLTSPRFHERSNCKRATE